MNRNVRLGNGVIMLVFIGLLYAWTIFRVPLGKMFPVWSATQLSLTFTIAMVCFCLGVFSAGQLSKRISSQLLLRVAGILLFTGFFGTSVLLNPDKPQGTLTYLYLFYGVFCGLGTGVAYNATLNSLVKWFDDKPGTASGLLLMGFALGGTVLGGVALALINSFGVKSAFMILGIVVGAVVLLSSFIIRVPTVTEMAKVDRPVGPAATAKDKDVESKDVEFTTSQMLSTSAFWTFIVWNILLSASGLLVMNSASTIFMFFGAPLAWALIVPLSSAIGRVLLGAAIDAFGRRNGLILASVFILAGGSSLYIGASSSVIFIAAGLFLIGMSYGGGGALVSVVSYTVFGKKNYASNLGIMIFAVIPAAIIGPLISSKLYDLSGGTYGSTFIMLTVFGVFLIVGALLFDQLVVKLHNKAVAGSLGQSLQS